MSEWHQRAQTNSLRYKTSSDAISFTANEPMRKFSRRSECYLMTVGCC